VGENWEQNVLTYQTESNTRAVMRQRFQTDGARCEVDGGGGGGGGGDGGDLLVTCSIASMMDRCRGSRRQEKAERHVLYFQATGTENGEEANRHILRLFTSTIPCRRSVIPTQSLLEHHSYTVIPNNHRQELGTGR
jgi:hypothetical protein